MTSTFASCTAASHPCFGDEWTVESNKIPSDGPRYRCAYASLQDDSLFLFGGRDADTNHRSDSVLEYNPASNTFTTHTPLPEPRSSFAATAIDEYRLMVVGGDTSSTDYEKSCRVYDTRTQEWSSDWPDLNTGRWYHTCITVGNKIYVLGGDNGTVLDSIEELDLSLPTLQWRILPRRLQNHRCGCRAVVDPRNPNNSIIVVGGRNKQYKSFTSCEIVALGHQGQQAGGQTMTIPPLSTPRVYHALVLVENRFLVVLGGNNSEYLSSVEVLDLIQAPQQQQWRALPSMRSARSSLASFTSAGTNKIVVAGGYDGRHKLDTVEEIQVYSRGQLPVPPVLTELPSGGTEIQRWLSESEAQMTGFVANVIAQQKVFALERDENRRVCNDYVSRVHARQNQARAILACMQDIGTTTTGNPPNTLVGPDHDDAATLPHPKLQNPPPLTELPGGHMDAAHRQKIEQWIEENEERKNMFVAVVDSLETELVRDLNESKRICDECIGQFKKQQSTARRVLNRGDVGRNGPPHELLCPITQEVMVDPVITADGHTYERSAIQLVFQQAKGKAPRSPVTGLSLTSRLLIPNVAVRSMCMDYADEHTDLNQFCQIRVHL